MKTLHSKAIPNCDKLIKTENMVFGYNPRSAHQARDLPQDKRPPRDSGWDLLGNSVTAKVSKPMAAWNRRNISVNSFEHGGMCGLPNASWR